MLVLRGTVVAGVRQDAHAGRLRQPPQELWIPPKIGGRALDERIASELAHLLQIRKHRSKDDVRIVARSTDLCRADEVHEDVLVHQRQPERVGRDRAGDGLDGARLTTPAAAAFPRLTRSTADGHEREGVSSAMSGGTASSARLRASRLMAPYHMVDAEDVRRARGLVAASVGAGRLRGGSRLLWRCARRRGATRLRAPSSSSAAAVGTTPLTSRPDSSMVLVEPSEGMRTVSRALNPECEHVDGDMRTVRLGRQFDAVFVHDAVCYMTTESDLRHGDRDRVRALQAWWRRALRARTSSARTSAPSTDHGGHDDADARHEIPGMDAGSRSR